MNKKSKKIIIISSAVAAVFILGAAIFTAVFMTRDNETSKEQTEIQTLGPDEFEINYKEDESGNISADIVKGNEKREPQISVKKPSKNTQVGIVVEGIEIESLAEINSRLCVIIKNTTDENIEFALLTVKAGDKRVAFKITAVMAGERAILICNDNVKYSENEYYVGWDIENKNLFDKTPDMQSNKYELTTADGEFTIKNKRFWGVKGPVYIVYKRTVDGILVGSETRRVKVDSLKMREEKRVRAMSFDNQTSKVIFIDD